MLAWWIVFQDQFYIVLDLDLGLRSLKMLLVQSENLTNRRRISGQSSLHHLTHECFTDSHTRRLTVKRYDNYFIEELMGVLRWVS